MCYTITHTRWEERATVKMDIWLRFNYIVTVDSCIAASLPMDRNSYFKRFEKDNRAELGDCYFLTLFRWINPLFQQRGGCESPQMDWNQHFLWTGQHLWADPKALCLAAGECFPAAVSHFHKLQHSAPHVETLRCYPHSRRAPQRF